MVLKMVFQSLGSLKMIRHIAVQEVAGFTRSEGRRALHRHILLSFLILFWIKCQDTGAGRGETFDLRRLPGGAGIGSIHNTSSPCSPQHNQKIMHKNLRIVVEGCCHGELDQIYASIALIEQESGQNVDLLICCGDFQAVRNKEDLKSMNVPSKYLTMASFHRYYSGEKVAPVLTIFIGGNHEASNHLQELYYGGWVAPNIYYLGCSGVVSVGGVRIAGISGIYNGRDYHRGHFEVPPYSPSTLRSIYHVREYEVFKLAQLASGSGARGDSAHVDVMLSHDWPRGIYHHGDMGQLLRTKPYFRKECETNTLGSQAAELLLNLLQPSYWFAGHLHCKFAAVVRHSSSTSQMSTPAKVTKFLALDKCLPNRDFLQLVEIPRPPDRWEQPVRLEYDLEWLAILRSTHSLLSRAEREVVLPRESRRVAPDDLEWVRARLAAACKRRGDDPSQALEIQPDAFVKTAPVHEPSSTDGLHGGGSLRGSPQTDALLKLLELGHRVTVPYTPCPPQAGAHVSQRSPSRRLESAQPGQRNSGEEEQRGTSLFFLDRGEDRGSSLPDPDSIDLDEVESAVCEDAVAQEYDRQEIVKPESEGGGGEDVIVFKGDHSPAHAAPGSQPSPRVHPSRPKLILPPPSLSD